MDMTVAGLLDAYRSGGTRPHEVIDAVLARCAAHEHLNIWIRRLTRAEIEPYLARLQGASPDTLPLYGIPFAIKDNIDLAGIPTTAACAAFAYTPTESAFVVQRLIDAGAIPLGKTNLDQFATGLVGTRSPWGACRNPFDFDYVSGGSSSGSAVAVALGLSSFALGTDTAGSGRVPAAFNNLIGVKPTRGIVSMTGVVPACRSLDCVSLFALTADDANAVLERMIGVDAADDYARANPFANAARQYGLGPDTFVFGVPREDQLEFYGDASARALFGRTLEVLEKLGGVPVRVDFQPFLDAARLLYAGAWVAERFIAAESIIATRPDALLPVTATIIGGAHARSAVDAFKGAYRLQHHRRAADAILETVDVLVTPTAATIYRIDQVDRNPIELNTRLGYYTNYMNLLDCAGVAVPAGFLANGLPWGVTLVGKALRDRALLSFANRLQQTLKLPPGATMQALPPTRATMRSPCAATIPVVVCGAHLAGLALNWQLRERGARLECATRSAAAYRLYALPGGPPLRPALVRDTAQGAAIEVEVWQVPSAEFGGFVAGIPAPLGIGKVELGDGRWLPGFICEAGGLAGAVEVTRFGGWRAYLANEGATT